MSRNRRSSSALATRSGVLIINADDWGRDRLTTDRIFECTSCGTVSSASAMVFMEDSDRAATTAREFGIDVGLHLNFTEPFSSKGCPARVLERQCNLAAYLRGQRYAQVVFHPLLVRDFDYVVKAQLDEFRRLYGRELDRLDGHHHMHLCANVVLQRLLPERAVVRRNFTFQAGEKSILNRFYRGVLDSILAKRHILVDYFFQLEPLEPGDRLRRIFSLGRRFVVEIEAHPAKADEYRFLTNGEILRWVEDTPISDRFILQPSAAVTSEGGDSSSSPHMTSFSGIQ